MDEERFKQLREKYDSMVGDPDKWANVSLDEAIEMLDEVEGLNRFLKFYKDRYEQVAEWQTRLPEPYRTQCRNILAHGKADQ